MEQNWEYETESDTYLFGTPQLGAGVFKERKGWTGNVVAAETVMLTYFPTKEEAMDEAERVFKRLCSVN